MKISRSRLQRPGGLAISAVLLLSVYVFGCQKGPVQPQVQPGATYYCKDRHTNVNPSTGVDDDTVAVCPGKKMTWLDKGEDWEVEFKNDSPFVGKPKKMNKGNPTGVARDDLTKDTPFPYTITVNGKKFDPQIIVMGGN
jgi:hypothetical protein